MKARITRQAIISTARIAAILAIGTIALLGLMAEPFDNDPWWWEKFFFSKGIALVGFSAAANLYKRWSKTDKWFIAYEESCKKVCEQPNPLYIDDED